MLQRLERARTNVLIKKKKKQKREKNNYNNNNEKGKWFLKEKR